MEDTVGLKELRQDFEKYATIVKKGKTLIVIKRSRPVFRLAPLEEEWEEVIDFTKIRKGGVSLDGILSRL